MGGNNLRLEEGKSYTLIDELLSFLDNESHTLLPILCGYFCKVVLALLNKNRDKFLEYILINQNG